MNNASAIERILEPLYELSDPEILLDLGVRSRVRSEYIGASWAFFLSWIRGILQHIVE